MTIQNSIKVSAQTLQDLINQTEADQSYRTELESYIRSHYVDSPQSDGSIKSVTLESALLDNESPIYVDQLSLDQLQDIVKKHLAGESIWGVIADIEEERSAPLKEFADIARNLAGGD